MEVYMYSGSFGEFFVEFQLDPNVIHLILHVRNICNRPVSAQVMAFDAFRFDRVCCLLHVDPVMLTVVFCSDIDFILNFELFIQKVVWILLVEGHKAIDE